MTTCARQLVRRQIRQQALTNSTVILHFWVHTGSWPTNSLTRFRGGLGLVDDSDSVTDHWSFLRFLVHVIMYTVDEP